MVTAGCRRDREKGWGRGTAAACLWRSLALEGAGTSCTQNGVDS